MWGGGEGRRRRAVAGVIVVRASDWQGCEYRNAARPVTTQFSAPTGEGHNHNRLGNQKRGSSRMRSERRS